MRILALLLFSLLLVPSAAQAVVALDGTPAGSTSNPGASAITHVLTTTHANDVIIVGITTNWNTAVVSISDTAGLTWHLRLKADQNGVGNNTSDTEEWYAISAGILTSDTVSITLAASSTFQTSVAFALNGANTLSPFDGSGVTSTSSNVACSINLSTTLPTDMILGFMPGYGSNSNPTVGAGYTVVYQVASGYFTTEYKSVTTAQTNLPVTATGCNCTALIADAIAATPASGLVLGGAL
jgi:hypothetical protein